MAQDSASLVARRWWVEGRPCGGRLAAGEGEWKGGRPAAGREAPRGEKMPAQPTPLKTGGAAPGPADEGGRVESYFRQAARPGGRAAIISAQSP